MNRILLTLMTITLLLFGGVVSAQTIEYNSTYNSIDVTFNPALENSTVYFNNEEVITPISDRLILTGLDSGEAYSLVIESRDTGIVQNFIVTTEEYKALSVVGDVSLFALLIVIAGLVYLSIKLPVFGYVAVVLSMLGLLTVLRTETEFLIILLYVLAFLGAAYNIVYDSR